MFRAHKFALQVEAFIFSSPMSTNVSTKGGLNGMSLELSTNLNVETNEESSSHLSRVNMAEITQMATEIRSRNQALPTRRGVRLSAGRKSFLNGSVIENTLK
uniref:Uncharacterized protein n=1 Tax=Romanomermis culicivorax TaxID=13658 RepID=A0A915JPY3_ROMCU